MMKFGMCILAGALFLGGCASKGLTDAEVFGPNHFVLQIFAQPSGALIYGEDGAVWGVAKEFVRGVAGLQKDFYFSNPEAARQGNTITITAVWASGAKSRTRLVIDINPDRQNRQFGTTTFSRPIDAPGLDTDFRVASQAQALSQTSPPSPGQNNSAFQAVGNGLAAFATGWAQAQAAAAANRPILCTSSQTGGMVNTMCN